MQNTRGRAQQFHPRYIGYGWQPCYTYEAATLRHGSAVAGTNPGPRADSVAASLWYIRDAVKRGHRSSALTGIQWQLPVASKLRMENRGGKSQCTVC